MTEVYDYVAGKADWLARGLPREGERATERRALDIAAHDVVTCPLDASVGDLRSKVARSRHGCAFVVSGDGVLPGRLRRSALEQADDVVAETVMEPGPSTIRADAALAPLLERMPSRNLTSLPVTTPEGRLLGVGLAKSLTNLGAGAFAARLGRRRLLIAGWAIALPVPLLVAVAPSWGWVVAANVLLGINQGLAWSMTVVMKIDLVGPSASQRPGFDLLYTRALLVRQPESLPLPSEDVAG